MSLDSLLKAINGTSTYASLTSTTHSDLFGETKMVTATYQLAQMQKVGTDLRDESDVVGMARRLKWKALFNNFHCQYACDCLSVSLSWVVDQQLAQQTSRDNVLVGYIL